MVFTANGWLSFRRWASLAKPGRQGEFGDVVRRDDVAVQILRDAGLRGEEDILFTVSHVAIQLQRNVLHALPDLPQDPHFYFLTWSAIVVPSNEFKLVLRQMESTQFRHNQTHRRKGFVVVFKFNIYPPVML